MSYGKDRPAINANFEYIAERLLVMDANFQEVERAFSDASHLIEALFIAISETNPEIAQRAYELALTYKQAHQEVNDL